MKTLKNWMKNNMTKKLKLRIVKFDHLLVVEQLEMIGEFEGTEHVLVHSGDMFFNEVRIDLQEDREYIGAWYRSFADNEERDEYVANLVNWITEEQFGGAGKLEVGKPCLISDDGKDWKTRFYAGKVAKQLGTHRRYLTKIDLEDDNFYRWKYAKPLNSTQPKIDGEIYTWEIEQRTKNTNS